MTTAATRTISFTLNGEPVSAAIATHHTLLEVVRDTFSLYGARESCGQGLCGCCTLIVDGRAVSGCLYLAAFADGTRVETTAPSTPYRRHSSSMARSSAASARPASC
jgi:aerobic-type carbon monoxide dehydrogenase small subunit (CoxS/CutS family)